MPRPSFIAFFILRIALWYGVLIVPWPGFNAGYARYFQGLGQRVFWHEESRWFVRFETIPESTRHVLDTRITLANRDLIDAKGAGQAKYLELDSRGVGWIPTALTIALILGTPVSWRRRGWALLAGLVLVHGYIVLALVAYIWNNAADVSLVVLSGWSKEIAVGLQETLINQLGTSFAVPVGIWIVVALRRQDLISWRDQNRDQALAVAVQSELATKATKETK